MQLTDPEVRRLCRGLAFLYALAAAGAVVLATLFEAMRLPSPRVAAVAFTALGGWVASGIAGQIVRGLDSAEGKQE